jgi:hypothetical protein
MMTIALLVLMASIASSLELERREARLRAGAPAWVDLQRITGVAHRRELVRLPGVSITGDGRPRFDPARRGALPAHLLALLLEHPAGHGACLALAVAVLGTAFKAAELPPFGLLLFALACCYQLLARLYVLTLWVEARTES